MGISNSRRGRAWLAALAGVSLWVASAARGPAADRPVPADLEIKRVAANGSVTVETRSAADLGLKGAPVSVLKAKPRAKLVPFPEDETRGAAHSPAQPAAEKVAERPASTFRPRFKTPAILQAQHTEPVDAKADEKTGAKSEKPADANREDARAKKDEPAAPAGAPRKLPDEFPAAEPTTSLEEKSTEKSAAKSAEKSAENPADKAAPLAADGDEEAATADKESAAEMPEMPANASGQQLLDAAFAKSKDLDPLGADAPQGEYTLIIDLCRRGIRAGVSTAYDEYARNLMGWAYNRRGESRAKAGIDKQALADFEAAVECNQASWRAIHNRAVSYAAAGRIKEALTDFDRTIELNGKYANAYFNRGELKYSQGDFAGAVRDFTTALKIGPQDAAMYNSRGHAFYLLARFGDALRDYSEAVSMEPENSAAMVNRGDAYADLGRYAEAANDYREAVRITPNFGRAYQSAAWLMATCPDNHYRDEKLAIEAAQKAIQLNQGGDFRDLEALAAALANAGQFAEAKRVQERAIGKATVHDKVAAEKRLAIYGRSQPFRERSQVAFTTPEEQDTQVRQASGTAPIRQARRPSPGGPKGRPKPRSYPKN